MTLDLDSNEVNALVRFLALEIGHATFPSHKLKMAKRIVEILERRKALVEADMAAAAEPV